MRALFTQHKKNKEEKWVIFCAFVLCLSLLSRFPRSLLSLSPLKRSETQRKSTGNKTWKQRLGYCVLFFLLHFNGTERKRSGSENEAKEKKDKEPNTRHPGTAEWGMNGLCEKIWRENRAFILLFIISFTKPFISLTLVPQPMIDDSLVMRVGLCSVLCSLSFSSRLISLPL